MRASPPPALSLTDVRHDVRFVAWQGEDGLGGTGAEPSSVVLAGSA
jgi:hypothetical protein